MVNGNRHHHHHQQHKFIQIDAFSNSTFGHIAVFDRFVTRIVHSVINMIIISVKWNFITSSLSPLPPEILQYTPNHFISGILRNISICKFAFSLSNSNQNLSKPTYEYWQLCDAGLLCSARL